MRRLASFFALFCLATLASAQQATPGSFSLSPTTQPSKVTESTKQIRSDTVLLVRGLAEKILTLQDVRAKAVGAARLASLLWNQDEPYARELFDKALAMTSGGTRKDELKWSGLRRTVITIIAKRDVEWAKKLIDASEKQDSGEDSKTRSTTNINTALALIEEDPNAAVQFADRSLQGGFTPAILQFLFTLRRSNEASANQLFLQILAFLAQQPAVDVRQFHLAGIYLFTTPDRFESEGYVITRVGDILVPNIAAQRPGVTASLTRAYLQTATSIVWRTINDRDQQQFSYALAYLLLPKARSTAPDLAPSIEGAMSALAAGVPPNLTEDGAYKNVNPPALSAEERLSNADRKPDQDSRDVAYLDLAFHAWLKGDFKLARTAAGRIANQEASARLSVLIDFGEGARLLKQSGVQAEAQAFANKLPPGIERSILLLAIAQAKFKNGDANGAKEIIESTMTASRSVTDVRRPFLTLIAAGQLARTHPVEAESLLSQAIKDFNLFDSSAYSQMEWYQTVEAGPLKARFPLNITNVELSFDQAFRKAISADSEGSVSRVEELKSEGLRSQGFVQIAGALLEKKQGDDEEHVVVVGEDGIRKSAFKTIMPSYPDDALKQRQQGVVVAELQYNGKGEVTAVKILEAPAARVGEAVLKAIRQWKFTPSKLPNGTPVSIRGKLTFYFQIDEDGNGHVENPKRFK